jgi:hypothetical protein
LVGQRKKIKVLHPYYQLVDSWSPLVLSWQGVLGATRMKDCKKAIVPADAKPLGKDLCGEQFDEPWEYASIVGMMLYISGHSRSDIQFAVNRAARFTQRPSSLMALLQNGL